MNKNDNHTQDKTKISIADIAIAHTRLVERLAEFRVQVETEAETSIANIETTLGLALADTAQALGIEDPIDLLRVLGEDTYLAIYMDPIPYQLAHPPHHAILLLLAKVRDTLHGRWGGKKVETPPPVPA